jgi:hypothetical protein
VARLRRSKWAELTLISALLLAGCTATLSGGEPLSDEEEAEGPVSEPSSPGAITMRRLTRTEYDNTVRDLLGTSLTPSTAFPADDLGAEFDTVGSALTLSPLYVLAYEQAADALAADLLDRYDEKSRAIITCKVDVEGEACARTILEGLAPRAFRRPVEASELDALLTPYQRALELGASPADGLRASLAAVLLSPAFLFKVELDEEPDSGAVRALDGYELATRLSYALWATTPDDGLLELAESGGLGTEEQIGAVIDQMLDDERSLGLIESFFASWLGYRELGSHEVEASIFPTYDVSLAADMQGEAARFFAEFLAADRPAREMLDAGFTYLNASLAQHYGIQGLLGADDLVRVDTVGTTRSGLLTLGAVLTATSFAARTSPTRRGQFVSARLLCTEIPPPPPGVEGLPTDTTGLNLRERLEAHREAPACKSCHEIMDPLGFGLENYDAIGRYRTLDGDVPVDAKGTLPDGREFDGAVQLGQALSEGDKFTACLTHKLVTFAVGRLVESGDPWLPYLEQEVAATGTQSFRDVIKTVLLSQLFRSRQAGEAD